MAFDAFDHDKKECIGTDMVGTILSMLGHEISSDELAQVIAEVDTWGKYKIIDACTQKTRIKTKTINKDCRVCQLYTWIFIIQ